MINPTLPPLIMDLLANNPGMTSEQIADQIQATQPFTDREIFDALHWLEQAEFAVQSAYPVWFVREAYQKEKR